MTLDEVMVTLDEVMGRTVQTSWENTLAIRRVFIPHQFVWLRCFVVFQCARHDEAWMVLRKVHDTNWKAKGEPERVFTVRTFMSLTVMFFLNYSVFFCTATLFLYVIDQHTLTVWFVLSPYSKKLIGSMPVTEGLFFYYYPVWARSSSSSHAKPLNIYVV